MIYEIRTFFFEESPEPGDFEEEGRETGSEEETEEGIFFDNDEQEVNEDEEEEEQDISDSELDTSFQEDVLSHFETVETMNYSLLLFVGFYVSFRVIRDLFGGIR